MRSDVVVKPGGLTDVDVSLSGDFTEMEEFIVQDLQLGGGTEAGLLQLRLESPALMDSVSAELMSRAGASDAAAALRLVAGATVSEGKYAVVRGLPDRFVVSMLNGFRLPTADEDKRAVQLDQFPAAVIESIQVTKTFTPDQQGDASGGTVNIVTKGIPDQNLLQLKFEYGWNSQVSGDDFLTYKGGGVGTWGIDDGRRIQWENIGQQWDGAVGVSRGEAPPIYKWSVAGGGRHELDNGLRIGGYASFSYERDAEFFDNGIDDSKWVEEPGSNMSPQYGQGTPTQGNFRTRQFDVTRGTESVQWSGLGTLGIESDNHAVNLLYLYTRVTEDKATLAEDTRSKQDFFPGHDPDDLNSPGHEQPDAAPYIRTETLDYTERETQTFQVKGNHALPELTEAGLPPELDWGYTHAFSTLDQPDKRLFGSVWFPARLVPLPGGGSFLQPAFFGAFKPAANFNLGNLQRIFKDIEETSDQIYANLKLPFKQWSDDEGYAKLGVFSDSLNREFNQETFSNFGQDPQFPGEFEDFWSAQFPDDATVDITESEVDVDYTGNQDIFAWYAMADLPLTSNLNLVGGVRFESTDLSIVNFPDEFARWLDPGPPRVLADLEPGDADVDFQQDDVLPSIAFEFRPTDTITLRGSYAQTVARQTFKELTPILQQEFLGGPVFIGNPDLQMAAVKNYDLRLDFRPYADGLYSASFFYKDITDTIEYVQQDATFTFTTPVNYPEGELLGLELEARQNLGHFWDGLDGLYIGANATFIQSEVTLPDDEAARFNDPDILAPMSSRDMTGAPEYLYNLYLTYDVPETGTQASVFYTVKGDTLVAGAGTPGGNFVPNVYATEYGELNVVVSQKLGRFISLWFKAKNLTNPEIQTVYRSEFIGADVIRTSYTAGIDLSIGISAEFTF